MEAGPREREAPVAATPVKSTAETPHVRRRSRVAIAVRSGLVAAILSPVGLAGYDTWVHSNDAAKHSRLASINAEASRKGLLSIAPNQGAWHFWSDEEVGRLLGDVSKGRLD